jgi:DNA invertase Pin-like site-specific DNA recombinase
LVGEAVSVLLGYARVSTAEQNADMQTDELRSAGCYAVFVDHASGVACQLDGTGELPRPRDHLGRLLMVILSPWLVN